MDKLPTPSINLAKNRGEHLSDRIIAFALSIGRVLVILTEAIALGAFLFRFGLDRQLVDLHDRIKQEQSIVDLLKNNESTYRNLQDRLALEKTIDTNTTSDIALYQQIAAMIPSDMALTTLSFSNTSIRIEGSLSSLISLSSLVKKLQANSAVDRVSIDKIENKTTEGTIAVSFSVFLKQAKNKPVL